MCKFCEAMKVNKQVDTILRKNDPEFSHRYSVAIVKRVFLKGHHGCRGTGTDYRYRGCGYQLNYCPECGASMKAPRRR